MTVNKLTFPSKQNAVQEKINEIIDNIAPEIYWCTYGTTSTAQILQAVAGGKLPMCTYNGKTYTYFGSVNPYYVFSTNTDRTAYIIRINQNTDEWSLNYDNFEFQYYKVQSLSASSTSSQYPSAKCTYDALVLKQDVSNLVTSISSSSTDTEYPSAKCVYDAIQAGGGGGSGLSYTATCPAITIVDGVATWSVTHSLGTSTVVASLYDLSGNEIEKNIAVTSNNAITVTWKASANISAGDFTIVVLAAGGENPNPNMLPSGTTITVGTSGADYTTLADAYSYLAGKWSNGTVTISITSDLTITDNVSLYTDTFNIPQLVINGNNHNITINFTQAGTYTPGFTVFNYNPVKLTNINFIGGTNGTTHILIGGYYTNSLYVASCTFDSAYGGVFGYNGSDIMSEGCTFLALQVGLQAQQSGTVRGRANTYGASGKQCHWAYNIYMGGIVRDGESTYYNYSSLSPSGVNAINSADGGIIFKV